MVLYMILIQKALIGLEIPYIDIRYTYDYTFMQIIAGSKCVTDNHNIIETDFYNTYETIVLHAITGYVQDN